jgi:hypothetical protein
LDEIENARRSEAAIVPAVGAVHRVSDAARRLRRDHPRNGGCGVKFAGCGDVALCGKLAGNLSQRAAAAIDRIAGEALGEGNHCRVALHVALAPAAFANLSLLSLASALEFCDKSRLLELRDTAENLADQDRGRRVV